jgi:hypothetical protein
MLTTKTTAKNQNWAAYLRNRVGDSVIHDNKVWSNLTGKNSEPSDLSEDWLFVQSLNTEIRPNIFINGNIFSLIKNPLNNDPLLKNTLEVNDDASNGAWDENEFWNQARYLGGGKDVKENWNRISFTEEIPTI